MAILSHADNFHYIPFTPTSNGWKTQEKAMLLERLLFLKQASAVRVRVRVRVHPFRQTLHHTYFSLLTEHPAPLR